MRESLRNAVDFLCSPNTLTYFYHVVRDGYKSTIRLPHIISLSMNKSRTPKKTKLVAAKRFRAPERLLILMKNCEVDGSTS